MGLILLFEIRCSVERFAQLFSCYEIAPNDTYTTHKLESFVVHDRRSIASSRATLFVYTHTERASTQHNMKPTLYADDRSPPVRSALMLCDELNIDVRVVQIDLFKSEQLTVEYLKVFYEIC